MQPSAVLMHLVENLKSSVAVSNLRADWLMTNRLPLKEGARKSAEFAYFSTVLHATLLVLQVIQISSNPFRKCGTDLLQAA